MNILLTISTILVILYVCITIYILKELPESISSMVYIFSKKWQWVWSAWMCIIAFIIMPPILDALAKYNTEFIGFLTTFCLIGTSITPIIQQETYKWHNILGITAGVLSQVIVAIICPYLLCMWIPFAIMLVSNYINKEDLFIHNDKITFFTEIICFISLILSLYII